MVQSGSGLGLLDKTPHAIRIAGDLIRQDLQGDFSIQSGVLRQIHLSHASRPELRTDFVTAEFCAGFKHHAMREEYALQPASIKLNSRRLADTLGQGSISGIMMKCIRVLIALL